MKELTHIRSAIYGEPWAITADWLDTISAIVERNATGQTVEFNAAIAKAGEEKKPYQVIDGVAILSLSGPLFPKANLLTQISGATSYQEYGAAFEAAMQDKSVNTVLQHVGSPGGAVIGCFEIADRIFEARTSGGKPIITLFEGVGASAAYAIGSQADQVYCTVGSVVGSIGVIAKVVNSERAERNAGNDPVTFRSSELKAPEGAMTPNQMQSIQKRVMQYFAMFKNTVARARNADIEAISTGETWVGAEAVKMGLVDGVTTFDKLLNDITK